MSTQDLTEQDLATRLAEAERRIAKLEKINAALMGRVERSMDSNRSAFSLFETAIALDHKVRSRTDELQHALRSLERSNDALMRAKTQAETANRSKTRFLASVSHDLLQPLNAARLTLSALAEIEMRPEGGPLVDQVDRALTTVEDLIRTLLDMSKLDAGVMQPELRIFPVAAVLEPLAAEFGHIAQRRGLSLSVRGSRAVVVSDPLMLRRIVQNLLANALRYTRRGGVLVGCRPRGSKLRIEVVDTGPGIPEDRREAVFEEFQRYDTPADDHAGFGLGLSIVRRLAQALGHEIDLSSRMGHGSIFAVSVPVVPASAITPRKEDAAPRHAPAYGLTDARILLIENDESLAQAMSGLLGRWGCRVVAASGADDAVEAIGASGFLPDLIIADLHLDSGERGPDAIEAVQAAVGRRLPAFVVTADHSEAAAEDIAGRGLELLRKPVKPAELRSLIAYLLA
jgi:signal transduction histidine kinase